MSVITISRECGCHGRTIGLKVAEELAYQYLDKELVVEVARLAEVPVSTAECFDENPEPAITRIFNKMFRPAFHALPYNPMGGAEWPYAILSGAAESPKGRPAELDEDTFVRLTQEAMMYWARARDLVCIGRGSQALLAHGFKALHMRLVAPWDFRVNTVMKQFKINSEDAGDRIRATDACRRLFIGRHYGIDWADPAHYHLVLNVAQLGVDGAVHAVTQTARGSLAWPSRA